MYWKGLRKCLRKYIRKCLRKCIVNALEKALKRHWKRLRKCNRKCFRKCLRKHIENALENMMKAYILYAEIKSPYIRDSEKFIRLLYQEFKKEKKEDIFIAIAKKYNIQITED